MIPTISTSFDDSQMGRTSWIWLVVLVFGFVFVRSLTFKYVDGDDASTIAYHALGRNADLQPPYGTYHAGMDVILSVLPAQENILRIVSMVICKSAYLPEASLSQRDTSVDLASSPVGLA